MITWKMSVMYECFPKEFGFYSLYVIEIKKMQWSNKAYLVILFCILFADTWVVELCLAFGKYFK